MGRPRKYQTDEERKAARREYFKQYYQNNAEYIKEQHKQYYKDHVEHKREYFKQYYQDNTEYFKQYYHDNTEYYKQYYQDNAEHKREYSKKWREQNAERKKQYYQNTPIGRANVLITSYRENDKKYNRGECTLTTKWIIENIFSKSCHYCGESNWKRLGCDRIDNTKPHTQDNVVPCCGSCNRKRGRKDYSSFVNEIKHKGYNQM